MYIGEILFKAIFFFGLNVFPEHNLSLPPPPIPVWSLTVVIFGKILFRNGLRDASRLF